MVRVLLILKHTGSQGLRGLQDSQGSLGLQDTLSLILTPTRLTICPGLAGTVPVLRPCPGQLVEMYRLCCLFGDHSIIHKRT